jgi:phospholipid/cholesterol/gamma-HCH transport system permease protein
VKNAPSTSLLTTTTQHGELLIVAADDWTSSHANQLEQASRSILSSLNGQAVFHIDMSRLCAFDTFGAWQLVRLARELKSSGYDLKITGLPERYASLFDAVRKASAQAEAEHVNGGPKFPWLASIGKSVAGAWQSFLLLLNMLGAICGAVVRAILKPSTFRFTSTIHQLDRVGWQAVPIILLITFLIGGIIAQQGFFHFRKFGADDYVVDMVGILVLREIGVLIVAIMVAGRSGSSYTAELGSMKMREEIDALRTMGFDPVDILILPRVVALVIALPILTFLGSLSALYGGELVAWLYGGMSPEIFVARLKEAISITHFKVGMIKAPFMALVIGTVACTEGLKVRGSAESLGLQTTASVVTSIFLVIVLDGLFAIFFASIGM